MRTTSIYTSGIRPILKIQTIIIKQKNIQIEIERN
jgi:hypothetical protein